MARINVLSKNIAELIAAGEVVERPASVVKELVENSIDAGATTITVEIKNGGITFIRITDNGHGIYHEDVPKAFLSHATSKLKTAEDLNNIFTLGFRGEALASVAAVARVEVLTKSPEEEFGTSYIIEGSEQVRYEQAGCPNGTTIVVRDIFFNTPARMKFLKKDVSEANAVADVVDKLAISHPEISFRFIRDGKQNLLTPGDSKLISAVYSVFGKDFANGLIETDYELDGVKVSGLVCKPLAARQSRAMQFFFLSGRYIKSRSCTASLENAYKNSIMVGKFPGCVLNITVPAHSVDVNVHPAKTEVRFSDERRVYSAVYYAVKTALENFDKPSQLDVSTVVQKAAMAGTQLRMETSQSNFQQKTQPFTKTADENPFKKRDDFWQNISVSNQKNTYSVAEPKIENPYASVADAPDLIGDISKIKTPIVSNETSEKRTIETTKENIPFENTEIKNHHSVIITDEKTINVRVIGEAFKTYIICEYDNKICLIDKHAAHERIIFNKLKNRLQNNSSQILLNTVPITLSKKEYNIIIENLNYFSKSGFLIEDFGQGSVVIRECPMEIDPSQAQDVVTEIASNLILNKTDASSDIIDMMLHTTACKAAIKAGNKNSLSELEKLANDVLFDENVRYCPHGRPVLIELTKYELEKQFGRIQ